MQQTQTRGKTLKNHAPGAKNTIERFGVSTATTYVDQNGEEKTFWTSIGTAFFGAKGVSIELKALPINGKLFINTQPRTEEN